MLNPLVLLRIFSAAELCIALLCYIELRKRNSGPGSNAWLGPANHHRLPGLLWSFPVSTETHRPENCQESTLLRCEPLSYSSYLQEIDMAINIGLLLDSVEGCLQRQEFQCAFCQELDWILCFFSHKMSPASYSQIINVFCSQSAQPEHPYLSLLSTIIIVFFC